MLGKVINSELNYFSNLREISEFIANVISKF